MKITNAHIHYDVIVAWAEGRPIEFLGRETPAALSWIPVTDSSSESILSFPLDMNFRIAPPKSYYVFVTANGVYNVVDKPLTREEAQTLSDLMGARVHRANTINEHGQVSVSENHKRKNYDAIVAWAKGIPIEYRLVKNGEWTLYESHTEAPGINWLNPSFEWRIQPKKFFWVFFMRTSLGNEVPVLHPEFMTTERALAVAKEMKVTEITRVHSLDTVDLSEFIS